MLRFAIFGYHATTRQCCQILLKKGFQVLHCYPRTRKITRINNSAITYFSFDAITDPDLFAAIHEFNADYIFSIICAEKIPVDIVRLCRHCALNFHPAPLPKCRTANAWFWPIRLGYTQSAITVHLLADTFDTGDIVYERKFPIAPMDNQKTYSMKVIEEMRQAMEELIDLIRADQIIPIAQSGNGRYYGKVKVRDVCIDWDKSTANVSNLIKACNPNHPAVTHYKNHLLEIYEALPTDHVPSRPGELVVDSDHLYCSCRDGVLDLTVFQFQGVLSARRFIDRLAPKTGETFTNSAQVASIKKILDRYL
jgi:methionyl-tRNA formyltransferase